MKIKAAASRSGLSPDTIRFYERHGVLPRPPRSENGYREYPDAHVETLRLVNGLRGVGASLEEIASIARLAHDGNCQELRGGLIAALDELDERVKERIADLRRTRRHVAGLRGGLEAMEDEVGTVPGAVPCTCFDVVGADCGEN